MSELNFIAAELATELASESRSPSVLTYCSAGEPAADGGLLMSFTSCVIADADHKAPDVTPTSAEKGPASGAIADVTDAPVLSKSTHDCGLFGSNNVVGVAAMMAAERLVALAN